VQTQGDFYDDQTSGNHDRLVVTGELTLESGGYIVVENTSGYNIGFGDIFNLMDWSTLVNNGFVLGDTGGLRDGGLLGDFELPTLDAGLLYDVSLFTSHGVVMIVPEPGRAMLLVVGAMALLGRRRRRRVSAE
jgi:hypothetical protein